MMNHLLQTIEATNSENYLENLSKIGANIHIVAIDSDLFFLAAENKETYKELMEKLPNHIDKLGIFHLVTAYWVAYVNYYQNDKFEEEMGKCLESVDENVVLLDSPHFCKKVYYYLNKTELVNNVGRS